VAYVLREEWEEAEGVGTDLAASGNRVTRAQGLGFALGLLRLFEGRSQEALELIERAIRDYPHPDAVRARLHNWAAQILLSRGEVARALEHAKVAQQEGKHDWEGLRGLYWGGLAEIRLGRTDAAQRTANKLKVITDRLPGPRGKRLFHLLAGELALARGDADRAVTELGRSQSTLPPRGFLWEDLHVPTWSSLASAHLATGDYDSAAEWLREIAESPYEHTTWPVLYVPSFYQLAKIHESRGEWEQARAYYRRFLDFWGDGDLDAEQVEEARLFCREAAQ
jgi:tetratricopeptide (TPR) repeat protein